MFACLQVEFFLHFQRIHPDVKIGQRTFEKLKPYFVRKLKDRYTCCCITHIQMSFLRDALNQIRQGSLGLHSTSCTCQCEICGATDTCNACAQTYSSTTVLWESIVCPKSENASHHKRNCLMGECSICGTGKMPACPREESQTGCIVTVKLFEDVEVGQTDAGKKKKRKVLSFKKMNSKELLVLFRDHLKKYIQHNYVYRWQAEQFKECLQVFPETVVLSVVDFAENYTFKEQNEIQTMHWYSDQVTIFVHITYIRVAGVVQKYYHFYISDDKTHDTLFVQHCFMLHHQWLQQLGIAVQEHWVWSDGAASQFKARRPFYFVARYGSLTGAHMTWNFSGSGHGKGEHDGAGAVIKRHLTHEQLKPNGVKLQCAHEVVAFLRETMSTGAEASYPSKTRLVSRVFWEIKLDEVDRSQTWDCKAIPNARSIHCVSGYSLTNGRALKSRTLSCFCSACMHGLWRRCSNSAHVGSWEYVSIEPTDDFEAEEETDNPAYEGHYDALTDVLHVDDNFAVTAGADNEELVDFYLLKCTGEKTCIESPITDAWGNYCPRGSYVVKGVWYEQRSGNPHEYNLLHSKPEVYMLSHLVRAIKFPMERIGHNLFVMFPDVYEAVYNSIPFDT